MTLERDKLEPKRYQYLSEYHSLLYDEMLLYLSIEPAHPFAMTIKELLEHIAKQSRGSHQQSTY